LPGGKGVVLGQAGDLLRRRGTIGSLAVAIAGVAALAAFSLGLVFMVSDFGK
jgi:hypothetical protein